VLAASASLISILSKKTFLSRNEFITHPGRQIFTKIHPKYGGDAQSYYYLEDFSFIEENLRKFHLKNIQQNKNHNQMATISLMKVGSYKVFGIVHSSPRIS
jgi:hypothetical protein